MSESQRKVPFLSIANVRAVGHNESRGRFGSGGAKKAVLTVAMNVSMRRALTLAVCLFPSAAPAGPSKTPAIDYARDVLPILAQNCFTCHGPDKEARKASLRLDVRDGVVKPARSGETPIVPGKAKESELIRRILAEADSERMPPPASKKTLTKTEKEILKRWIDQGAEYKLHWAYVKPTRPALPAVKDKGWVRNPIDAFILDKLEHAGLKPSYAAERTTLIRRLSFDLRGLPPSLTEIDAFLADKSADAYEKLVERFLASEHYGEKMAQLWLDLARFGDTSGFHQDSTRQMWMWRDWVIGAFNKNMPYDRFTIEQLAGDLLPEATVSQKVASGFNRNTRFNEEGGADPEEFVIRYNIDRVSTLGQVWLGQTLACAECHDHKYDPFSQKEFYQLYAYFNGLKEPMVSMNHNQPLPPLLKVATPEQEKELARLAAEIKDLDGHIQRKLKRIDYKDPFAGKELPPRVAQDYVWVEDDIPPGAMEFSHPPESFKWILGPDEFIYSGKRSMVRTGDGLHQHFFAKADPPLMLNEGDKFFTYVWIDPNNAPTMLMMQWYDGAWEHRAYWGEDKAEGAGVEGTASKRRMGPIPEKGKWVRLEVESDKVGFKPGAKIDGWAFTQCDGTVFWDRAGIHTTHTPDGPEKQSLRVWESRNKEHPKLPVEIKKLLKVEAEKRTEAQQKELLHYFLHKVYAETREDFAELDKERDGYEKEMQAIEARIPHTMVSEEMESPPAAHVLLRGDFLHKGEKVARALPAILPPLPKDAPNNRLGLARWLVQADQPLTARVAVNRFWAQLFGTGIVKTIGDFGVQGEAPSHPELLDWLAVEFVEKGWDVKHIMRMIVLSNTYRQASGFPEELPKADPYNRLLSRMPRFRLTAEEVRDNALAVSGLLTRRVGGPSFQPYQPGDYYRGKFEGWTWLPSKGEDQYRRGMYTFWRRTALHPMFLLFDAPTREECMPVRTRTNTALQALVTLNDPTFVEAARVFAQNVMNDGPEDLEGRIQFAVRTALGRKAEKEEVAVLKKSYEQALAKYQRDRIAASKLVHVGEYPRSALLDISEHAAWTSVAGIVLNLDEAITRE